jgi:AraC-like DNA-binding protein
MVDLYETINILPNVSRLITSKGLLFAYYVCPQNKSVDQIFTSENYFLHALSGRKIIHSSGKSFELKAGSSVLVRKGGYFMERFNDEFIIMEIFCSEQYINQLIQEIKPQLPGISYSYGIIEPVIEFETNSSLQACYDSLLPYFSQVPQPSDYLIELKFKEFLLNVLLNPENSKIRSFLTQTNTSHRPSLQQVMEDNYIYNMSLEDYAKLTCRSLATFKREFNEIFKISPGKWLMNKKLNHSRLLLINTDKNIGDIAFESGFESTSHFSRVFKEKFQSSPVFYRKKKELANFD